MTPVSYFTLAFEVNQKFSTRSFQKKKLLPTLLVSSLVKQSADCYDLCSKIDYPFPTTTSWKNLLNLLATQILMANFGKKTMER